MKKLLSYLLVIALVLVQFVPLANAETISGTNQTPNTNGKIIISNTVSGQKYEIYKLFDLESYSYDNTNGNEKGAYTYTITEGSDWYDFVNEEGDEAGENYVTLTPYGTEEGKYIVTWKENANAADFARAALDYAEAVATKISPTTSETANSTTVEFTGLELGYYLVDSSLGALVSLNTTNATAEIEDKNGVPVIDKGVHEDSDAEGTYGDNNTADIGQTVEFQTIITAQAGAQDYILYDTMEAGLTLDKESIVVKKNDTVLTAGTEYTVSFDTTGYTFVIDFSDTLEKGLVDNDKLVITYEAELNENAEVGGDGTLNETFLKYGDESQTEIDYTRTYTFSFNLIKKTSKENTLVNLDGAEFELWTAKTGGTKINLVEVTKDGQTYYRVATPAEVSTDGFKSAIIKVGTATIKGLDEDTYYLEETKAPEGYNRLTSRVEVKLDATFSKENPNSSVVINNTDIENVVDYNNDDVNVINTTGSLLPSTGGMGTVLFITVGSIMVLGFGVLLVTKLRLSKMSI